MMVGGAVFDTQHKRQVLIVTGLSGSGKSSVMRGLEDIGFYCVDNFPIPLLSPFLNLMNQTQSNLLKVGLCIDARGSDYLKDAIREIQALKAQETDQFQIKVVFINSSDGTLLKRFQETRRAHPLAKGISLAQAIKKERSLMAPVEQLADEIHYTDESNIHELRRWVQDNFSDGEQRQITINIVSFGFKYGVPAESNLVYDLRFLPNPYFIPALRAHDGRDADVQSFLFGKPEVVEYWEKLEDFLRYSLQKYYEEGRFFVNVAIGCTGGKHRSVAFAQRLGMQRWPSMKFLVYHRDVGKE